MEFIDWVDTTLDKTKKPIFYLIMFAHFLYFVTYFGIITALPNTLAVLDTVTQTFVCLFLLFRFHPFRNDNAELGKYDKRLIFGSGMLLFSNLVAIKLAKYLPTPIPIIVR